MKQFLTKEQTKNVDERPQDEKFITKPELDKLFKFKFSTDELNLTRDRFILQLMFGGLRINEFRPGKDKTGGGMLALNTDGYGHRFVEYHSSHNEKLKEIHNPLNEYTEAILDRHKGEIPFYKDKKGNPTKPDLNHYNSTLKVMAKEIGIFKRKVKDKQRDDHGKMQVVKVSIEDDITSLYARHSIYPIFKYKEMPKEQIRYFTGHSGKTDASDNYDPKFLKDVEHKRRQLKKYDIRPA